MINILLILFFVYLDINLILLGLLGAVIIGFLILFKFILIIFVYFVFVFVDINFGFVNYCFILEIWCIIVCVFW